MPAIIPIPALTDNWNRPLRAGEPAAFDAAEAGAGRKPVDAVDPVAALRDWKNKF